MQMKVLWFLPESGRQRIAAMEFKYYNCDRLQITLNNEAIIVFADLDERRLF
jgi:hypothetical protein